MLYIDSKNKGRNSIFIFFLTSIKIYACWFRIFVQFQALLLLYSVLVATKKIGMRELLRDTVAALLDINARSLHKDGRGSAN